MKIRVTLEQSGTTATGIRVPDEVVAGLGSGKRPKVVVTINGYSYRSTVMPYNGANMLPVSAEVRAGAGIAAGQEIEIELMPDTAPRDVAIPGDLQAAFARDDLARQIFDELSYSNKRRLVLPIEEAKTAETRERRVAKTISQLREGKI